MKHNFKHQIKRAISTPDYLSILILRTTGNFLILISLFTVIKTFYEPLSNEVRFFIDKTIQKHYIVSESKQVATIPAEVNTKVKPNRLAQIFRLKQVEIISPEDPNFSIVIPKIAANAKIIPNVNAGLYQEYREALKKGVAHADGTVFPGEAGHIYLFAHSTDYWWNVGTYNAIFYLLYKLDKGDEVYLFYQGKRFAYKVIGSEVVDPSHVEYLTRKSNKEFLTLQTCWPPGTTLKRLVVFAVRVRE